MEEEVLMMLISFTFFLALAWMIVQYRKWKFMYKDSERREGDNSLGMSELQDLMREAVEAGNEPLLERIEALEEELRRADAPRLMPAQRDELLEELEQASVREAEPAQRRA